MTAASDLHPVLARDPDFQQLNEKEAQAQADYDAALARNEELRAGWQRELERAILEGRDAPPPPTLVDDSMLRHTLRSRRELVRKSRDELVRQRGDELAVRLLAREKEILEDVARVLPRLRKHAEEIRSLLQALHRVRTDTAGLPLPRLIDVDELLHVAAMNADNGSDLSFLRGHGLHTPAPVVSG
jgi:hypothetical protein